jgi:GNAT superfamily N-acetyltransferase
MIEIRPGIPADAEAIARIAMDAQAPHAEAHPDVFKPPSSACFAPEEIRALMASPGRTFVVASQDGAVVGYVYAEVQQRPDTGVRYAAVQLYVHQMGVLDSFRRRGIGSQLLIALRDLARARGISRLALDVWRFNARARSFYEAHGFQVYQEKMWAATDIIPG